MKKTPDPKKMKRVKGPKISAKQLEQAKVRVTTYLDQRVLDELRTLAKDSGSKYQTVLNQVLNDYLFGKKDGLVARIEKLENVVFKDVA